MTAHTKAFSADSLVRQFDGLKPKSGGGYLARCPAHEDRQQSLSIDVRNGKILLRCFAGCDVAVIAAAKGLTLADLFLEDAPPASRGAAVVPTVDTLAAAKGLPVETLKRFGVRNVADMTALERLQHGVKASEGVWIPYFNPDGSIASRTRLRFAHVAKDGSRWAGSFGAPLPYGLHDLADAAEQGMIVICEGESDYWSLREMGAPALGIPGATSTAGLKREYLPEAVHTVYVCLDADAAGIGFVAAVRELCAGWGLQAVPVRFPNGCKDANDFYRKDPSTAADRFMALLGEAAAAAAPAVREFSTAGEIYRYTLPEWELALEVDQIQRKWGDLVGELAVLRESGADIFRGSVNLSNVERRQGVALQIAKRAGLKEIDWPGLVEEFAVLCLKAERTGKPGVWLHEVEPQPTGRLLRALGGMDLPVDLPSCLFGDGDTGKSYLALAIIGELSAAGLVCGIVDAEMEATIHAGRLRALFGDRAPRVAHLRLDRPLALAVDAVRRFVRDRGVTFMIYDSVGFLTPEPEKSESALGYMRALRQVGVGSLSIAHVTKAKDVKPSEQKPFGSNFYYQSFRGLWYAQAEAEADPSGRKVIAIHDRKGSVKGKRPPFGVSLTVRDGFAAIGPAELEDAPELAAGLPLGRRIEGVLRAGPQTVAFVAEVLSEKEATIRRALDRGVAKGYLVKLPEGVAGRVMWALAAKEARSVVRDLSDA